MSASGAPASAQAEVVEQPSEASAVAEVELSREVREETAPGVRAEAAARIRAGQSLPPALRDCLARVVEASAEAAADGKLRVPIEEAVRAVEEALPEFLRPGRGGTVRADHPAGEAFFLGEGAELSDAEAEEIARGQLARSGLLRGQRARAVE